MCNCCVAKWVNWILSNYHPPVFDRQPCLCRSHLPLHCRHTHAFHSHNRGTGWSAQLEESWHLRPGHLSLGHHRSNTLPKTHKTQHEKYSSYCIWWSLTEASQHVDLKYLVPHGVTRRWVPVEADASGSGCFGLRVSWGGKVTTRGGGFLVYVALLLHHGNIWRFGSCGKWRLEDETNIYQIQYPCFRMNLPLII